MIDSPWDVLLTVAFAGTGVFCLVTLIAGRADPGTRSAVLSDTELVHVNHGLMSASMVAMVWVMSNDVMTWAQIAIFAILTTALLLALPRVRSTPGRVELGAHVGLNLAMMWMLWAMPLLMAGSMTHGGGGAHSGHAGHEGHGGGAALASTPLWADVTNWAFVGISALAAIVFAGGVLASKHHRAHAGCHVIMAAGMAAMLIVMN